MCRPLQQYSRARKRARGGARGLRAVTVAEIERAPHRGARIRRALRRITRSTLRSAVAVDRGNHVARWLTTLPPNVLDSGTYRRALAKLARERYAGPSRSSTSAPSSANARAPSFAVARANEPFERRHRSPRAPCSQSQERARTHRARRQRHLLRHRRHQPQVATSPCTSCTRTCRAAPLRSARCSRSPTSMRRSISTAGSRSRRTTSDRAPTVRRKS